MSNQDDQFLSEQVDEQIEALAQLGNNSILPEARLVSNLRQVYEEEYEIARQVWIRLDRHIVQDRWNATGQKSLQKQAPHIRVKEAQSMKTKIAQQPSAKKFRRVLEIWAALLIIVALVGSMTLLLHAWQTPQSFLGSRGAATSAQPPTSVALSVSIAGASPTTQSEITIPSGKSVTLTVIPDHSLLPFQTFTMGIYATDPEEFSELQYCTYPKTDTCSYTLAYSSSEQTNYTQGVHTFRAFLGNIGGSILTNSNSITVTWS